MIIYHKILAYVLCMCSSNYHTKHYSLSYKIQPYILYCEIDKFWENYHVISKYMSINNHAMQVNIHTNSNRQWYTTLSVMVNEK
jgi:hypothetical protein